MAIQDSFSLSNAVNSQSYAYKCWYNYNYGNNTMGISAKDMGEITQTWNSQLSNWRATALDDENAYEIEDDDFSTAKMNGKNQAKDATGYDGGGKGGMVARGLNDLAAGAGGAIVGAAGINVIGKAASEKVGNTLGGLMGKKASEKAMNKLGEEGVMEKTQSCGAFIVTAPLALATGVAYQAKKPNKEQKEACDALQDEMNNADAALGDAQGIMQDARDEVESMSDDAQTANEDANSEIEDKKSEYDTYKASYDALMEKVNNGEQLTDDEKELLKELVPIMQQLGVDIADTQEETTDTVGEIYDEMGSYQDAYDDAASTVAEVEGLTDYAESFDDTTRTMCYVEGAAQTLNAASGGKAALQAGKFAASGGLFTAWAWAFAGMGTAGAAMSGVGAAQQFQWAGDVGTEIGMRKDTQSLNSATNDIYDESIDIYEGQLETVNDLEIEMPDDLADPEAVAETLNEETSGVLNNGSTSSDAGLGASTQTAGAKGSNNGTASSGADKEDKDKKVV